MTPDSRDPNSSSHHPGDVEGARSALAEVTAARRALRHGARWERWELVGCGAALSVATFMGHAYPHTAYLWIALGATLLALAGVIASSSRRVVSRSITRVSRLSVGAGTVVAMAATLILDAVEASRPSILAAIASLAPLVPLVIGALWLRRR
jgi:hypothetical protein